MAYHKVKQTSLSFLQHLRSVAARSNAEHRVRERERVAITRLSRLRGLWIGLQGLANDIRIMRAKEEYYVWVVPSFQQGGAK